ncbi:EAL domain-containing protein [Pseudoxanthomonas sp. CF125]|uniref:EAL domain-containing protein n=1 Tax=Pseudoxanthomonas sp. CF125 TaxID=1855303 RepID=UPI00088728D1|nr:EAL domain-containing protein [Pseudoxanthomonas sp. CF125]SDQ35491.1 PAS domain S-box-containing protein [Pseudoxanthomonas sp. CF125]
MMLALLLALGLAYVVANDRTVRLEGAQRQSSALAAGAARLLTYEFRNLERALLGVAGDAELLSNGKAGADPSLLLENIAGVASRQRELEGIVLVDPQGNAMIGGQGDPTLPRWIADRTPGPGSALRIGHLYKSPRGRWLLPIAVPLKGKGYVLARFRIYELRRIVAGLDTGKNGTVAIIDREGTLLAHNPEAVRLVGKTFPKPRASAQPNVPQVSEIDGVPRLVATSDLPEYSIRLTAGIAAGDVLKPWHLLLGTAVAVYLAYLMVYVYLLVVLKKTGAAQEKLLAEIQEGASNLSMAQQVGGVGTWMMWKDSKRLQWSDNVNQMLGISAGHSSASPEDFYALVHPDDRAALAAVIANALLAHEKFETEYRIVAKDGTVKWISLQGASVRDHDSRLKITGTIADVTPRVEAQKRITDAERQFRLIFNENPLPFWVFDAATLKFLEVNSAAVAQYGYSRDEFLGMSILDIRPDEDKDKLLADVSAGREGFHLPQVWTHQRKDGSLFEVNIHTANLEFGGKPARLILAEDISASIEYEQQLAFRASRDLTTGLLNIDELTKRLEPDVGDGLPFSLAYLQIKGLDLVADTQGRASSDALLRAISHRLTALIGEEDLAAHLPSDTFVLAVRHGDSAQAVNEALTDAILQPIESQGRIHHLEAWVGSAEFPADGGDAAEIVRNAALAAHVAQARKVLSAPYIPAMSVAAIEQQELVLRIRQAINAGELVLHFQTIADTESLKASALEALVRWPQPDGTFIPPSEFIPLAESYGLINQLGQYVLDRAASSHRLLELAGFGHIPIAVNVSAQQFLDTDFYRSVSSAISEHGIRRGALHVELTESIIMSEPERAIEAMRRLQAAGVRTSIDDFGTGFSSLSYLKHLPLDFLKIDQSFVADVHSNPGSAAICRALLTLAHTLGLSVIAEGVENQEQYLWLKQNGCEHLQGYFIARPEPLDVVIRSLQKEMG